MKMLKKEILALLLSFAMIFSNISLVAFAEGENEQQSEESYQEQPKEENQIDDQNQPEEDVNERETPQQPTEDIDDNEEPKEDINEEEPTEDIDEVSYTITIKYIDKETEKEIKSASVLTFKENDHYRISEDYIPQNIDNYEYVSVEGETEGDITGDLVILAFYQKREEQTYKLIINYLEYGTNKIIRTRHVVSDLKPGDRYNISNLLNLAGYKLVNKNEINTMVEIVDKNIEINAYYSRIAQYTVTVNYLDQNGNKIISSVVSSKMDSGTYYDFSKYNAKKIRGYKYVETRGDSLVGTLDSNKVINVYYKKLNNNNMIVNTFDSSNMALWIGVAIIALVIVAICLFKKSKK